MVNNYSDSHVSSNELKRKENYLMKKVAAILTAIILAITIIPAKSYAVTCQYPTTQAFVDSLDEEGIRYSWLGVDSDGDEHIRITYNGNNMPSIQTDWYFEKDPQRVSFYVWDIIHFENEDYYDVLDTVNTINKDYRYLCFYIRNKDNSVNANYCMPLIVNSTAALCSDVLHRFINILDDVYVDMQKYDIDASSGSSSATGVSTSSSSGSGTSGQASGKYLTTGDLPGTAGNMAQLVKDWLAFPAYNSDFHAVNSEVTINKGERTKLSLFRNENYNGASYSYKWYGDGEVSLDWAGNGIGWAGHSHVGYITATEPCTIFMSAEDDDGITAHMVIYVK